MIEGSCSLNFVHNNVKAIFRSCKIIMKFEVVVYKLGCAVMRRLYYFKQKFRNLYYKSGIGPDTTGYD